MKDERPSWNPVCMDAGKFQKLQTLKSEELIEGLLCTQELGGLVGWRGTAKTRFLIGMANALTTKTSFLGCPVPKVRTVLYVDGELPTNELKAILKQFGACSPLLYVIGAEYFHNKFGGNINFVEEADRENFFQLLESVKPDVIMFDSLATLFKVDENVQDWKQEKAKDFLKKLRLNGFTVILAVHAGKNKRQRGHSGMEDPLDFVVGLLGKNKAGQPAKIAITFTKGRKLRFNEISKSYWELLPDEKNVLVWTAVPIRGKTGIGNDERCFDYLRWIDKHQPKTQNEIAKAFRVSKSAVSQELAKLRNLRHLEKNSLSLTKLGHHFLA
jgi:RecA-family ATPase